MIDMFRQVSFFFRDRERRTTGDDVRIENIFLYYLKNVVDARCSELSACLKGI